MTTPSQIASRVLTTIICAPDDPQGGGRRFVRSLRPYTARPPRRTSARETRPSVPAVDPSKVFGCVDWFLYPDPERERANR